LITVVENSLAFDFPVTWRIAKYDKWTFYLNHFQSVCSSAKGVDIIALVPSGVVWLIEVKDYRAGPRQKQLELAEEVAQKVRDTLAGLAAARVRALVGAEQDMANRVLQGIDLKVVLHLEQGSKPTRLHPVEDHTKLVQKLKQLLRAIDHHPKISNLAEGNKYGWEVREV
jgi:hypothetical protein